MIKVCRLMRARVSIRGYCPLKRWRRATLGTPSPAMVASSQARNINDKYPDAHQVKYTTPWRGNKVLDVSYNRFRAADRFRPTAGTAPDAIAKIETTSNTTWDAASNYNVKPQFRDQFQVSASYFAGRHDVLVGYQIVESAATRLSGKRCPSGARRSRPSILCMVARARRGIQTRTPTSFGPR